MSIANIEDYIKQESTKEINKILDETEKNRTDINEQAKKDAIKLRQDLLEEGRHKAKLAKIKIISEAKINQKKEIEAKKEEIIIQCFSEAEEELKRLRGDTNKYSELLKSYINDAKAQFGNDITVLCDQKDEDLISKYGVSYDTSISTAGGIVVTQKNGKSQLDYRFEHKFEVLKQELRPKIAKLLFS